VAENHEDPRPLREQIAADLRALILDGGLRHTMPSTTILAAWFGTSGNTIQHALEILKAEKLIASKKGRATQIIWPEIITVRADPDPQLDVYKYKVLDVTVLRAVQFDRHRVAKLMTRDPERIPAGVDRALELGVEDSVVRRLRVMRLRETNAPVELSWSYYPLKLVEGTEIAASGPVIGGTQRVLDEMGLPAVEFEDRVSTRVPTTQELEVLQLPPFVSVLRTERIVWSHGRKPIEATVMIKGGHLFNLLYRGTTH
jgi:GntR family transcriptional regulator